MKTKFLQRVLWLMIPLLTIFTTNVWGETVTIGATDTWTGGKSGGGAALYITKGGITINISSGYKASTSEIRWYSGATMSISSSVGNITEMAFTISQNPSSISVPSGSSGTYSGSTKKWTGNSASFSLKSSAQVKWSSITITYTAAEPKYTLKVSDGLGGYTTYSNKVKSDLTESTAMGGHECSGDLQGAYSGWRTSSLETPAGSPGTTYSHATAGAMPATGSTLYAVYYSYDEGGYLTNTLCEPTCANTVTVAKTLAQTNGSISLSSTSVATCGEAASRQVTVTVDPVDCYIPQASEVTWTGTSVTKVSGPTLNGSGNYDYVFQFAQNATGTTTFDCSLATKETYTVSYDAGNTTCTGGNAITGSKANDTKTCGTSLTLPGETFHTTGYTQTGWTKTPCGSQTNGLGGTYSSNAAQTFYPVWTANKYTVTWSVNGSTYTTTANVTYNTTTSTPANPSVPGECTGSTFMGWTSNSSWASDSAPGDLFNGTSPTITGNITFYAVFADEN